MAITSEDKYFKVVRIFEDFLIKCCVFPLRENYCYFIYVGNILCWKHLMQKQTSNIQMYKNVCLYNVCAKNHELKNVYF